MNGLKGIFDSRKAVMVVLMLATLTYLLITGKIDQTHYAGAVATIKSFWLGAHAHEERGKMPAVTKLLERGPEMVLDTMAKTATADKSPADEEASE